MKYDPNFTAAKKVTQEEKERERARHEAYSRELFGENVFVTDEVGPGICMLEGCNLLCAEGSRHRFCNLRHFYSAVSRQVSRQDPWRRAALAALTTLALNVPGADAAIMESESMSVNNWIFLMTILVVVVFALVGLENVIYKVYLHAVSYFEETKSENLKESKDVLTYVNASSNVAAEDEHIFENDMVLEFEYSEAARPRNEDDKLQPTNPEWTRWSQIINEVNQERPHSESIKLLHNISSLDVNMRILLQYLNIPTERWRTFMKAVGRTSLNGFGDKRLKSWCRSQNEMFVKLVELNRSSLKHRHALDVRKGVDFFKYRF